MWDGTLGVIRATKHAIVTPPDGLPIRAQPYRTGPFKRQIMSDQIHKILKLKVISPRHSAWASPVVIVPKKNGKARFCVDCRQLNNITKKDSYPLPRMEDCLDSSGDAQVFTSLDCTAGYWQVPLRNGDQEKTAFKTQCGIGRDGQRLEDGEVHGYRPNRTGGVRRHCRILANGRLLCRDVHSRGTRNGKDLLPQRASRSVSPEARRQPNG